MPESTVHAPAKPPREVDCLILWHYFDTKGRLVNASMTQLVGTRQNLKDRIEQSYQEAKEAQNGQPKLPYSVPVQILGL